MTRKLNQVVAVEKTVKSRANQEVNELYHMLQKTTLYTGIARTYKSLTEDGTQFPNEVTLVQQTVEKSLASVREHLTKLFDVVATKEWGNTSAFADIVVAGKVIMAKVPVPFLLFLEKQLVDVRTIVSKLPTLDPAESWTLNKLTGVFETPSSSAIRTEKKLQNHIKAEATDKHPAQVETYNKDVPIGTWSTIKSSGALPVTQVNHYLAKIDELALAVKVAREEANSVVVEELKVGESVFKHIFGE